MSYGVSVLDIYKNLNNNNSVEKKLHEVNIDIKSNRLAEVQDKIDNLSYPANYSYDIDTLEPKGQLKTRFEYWQKHVPELLGEFKRVLSVGCSLGYLLLYHSKNSELCYGIEPDPNTLNLLNEVIRAKGIDNIKTDNYTFAQMNKNETYDLIWMGNVFHYMYVDYGWNVAKVLANISSKYCVIEAPLEGSFLASQANKNPTWGNVLLMAEYNSDRFFLEMSRYFEPLKVAPSGTDPENRVLVLLKRKKDITPFTIDKIGDKELLKENKCSKKFITEIDGTKLVYKRIEDNPNTNFVAVFKAYQNTHNLQHLDYLVKIYDYKILDNGKYFDVLMEHLDGYEPINEDRDYQPLIKKHLVERMIEILDDLFNQGYLHIDADFTNFMFNGLDLKLIDLDVLHYYNDIYPESIDWLVTRLERIKELSTEAAESVDKFIEKVKIIRGNCIV